MIALWFFIAFTFGAATTATYPEPGLVTEGMWQGCTVSADATTIDCPYANLYPERQHDPNDVAPVPPVDPQPDPDPNPDPNPEPEPEPEPEPDPDCEDKPGYGYGDENHCHYGPPGQQ